MRPDRRAGWAAGVGVASLGLAACWGAMVRPELWLRWLLVATLLPAVWAYVEVAQVRGRDEAVGRAIMTMIRYCIAWGGLMISLRLTFRLAIHGGFLDPAWVPVGQQLFGLALGVGMILFGNALPTLRSPWPYPDQPFAWQQVHRFVGWMFVLGGVVVVGIWLTMPEPSAARTAPAVVAVAAGLSVIRKFASVFSSRHGRIAP